MNVMNINNLKKIESFNGNFAVYYNTDGMAGIINRQGEIIFEADKYDYAWEVRDGIYVLDNFKEDIHLTFDANTSTRIMDKRVLNHGSIYTYREGDKEGICTLTFQKITAPLYDLLVEWGEDNTAFVAKLGDKFGVIDFEGKELLSFQYDDVVFVTLADHILKYRSVAINGEYFWIDVKGNRVSKHSYEYLQPLNKNGYAIMKKESHLGIIDANENVLCLTDYTEIDDGQITYSRFYWCTPEHISFYKNGLFGIMDKHGNVLQEPRYTKVDFQPKDYLLSCKDAKGKAGMVTQEGTIIIPFVYDWIVRRRKQGLVIVRKEDKYGVMDEHGSILIPVEYEYLCLDGERGISEIAVKKDGECYFIDEKQERVSIF